MFDADPKLRKRPVVIFERLPKETTQSPDKLPPIEGWNESDMEVDQELYAENDTLFVKLLILVILFLCVIEERFCCLIVFWFLYYILRI